MKYQYKDLPETLRGTYGEFAKNFGFSWKEFVMAVPSPLFLATTYKSNGAPNACMQSWATFTSANRGEGFYAILSSVNKGGHFYRSLQETKEAVLNFPSADTFDACMATIRHNSFEQDEITASGLTAQKAAWVNAPLVRECFMNLECRYLWEKEIVSGDDHVLICLEVIGAHLDEAALSDKTGENGLLYNIHHPIDPQNAAKTGYDYTATLVPKPYGEAY